MSCVDSDVYLSIVIFHLHFTNLVSSVYVQFNSLQTETGFCSVQSSPPTPFHKRLVYSLYTPYTSAPLEHRFINICPVHIYSN
uniref:Uncharacterized protein n=1 Tax=Arion vulgaris TaxID=1028688 RepID=A0A0B7AUU1_9EUPU